MSTHYSAQLTQFAAELKPDAIPQSVIARTEDLFVDWFASAIGGKGANPVEIMAQFAQSMGPHQQTAWQALLKS